MFMTIFTATQIFSAFSQERVLDSDRYEWLFFDESINASRRKRKTAAFRRDKRTTAFLDDNSDMVRRKNMLFFLIVLFIN